MLKPQIQAPNFSLPDQSGETVSLDDFKGKQNVVLYFYPKDDTPGCTVEANQFTVLIDEFASVNTSVMGVSKNSCESHRAFIKKYALKLKLISDPNGELCERYGVWQEKEKNGVKTMGIVRSTFIINKKGQLIDVEYAVSADGHAQKVLEKIKAANL